MISKKEILMGRVTEESLDFKTKENLEDLLRRVNILRAAYGKPMKVSSGYRAMEDHLRIYKEKGITDKSKIPMKSKHLYCQAVDFADAKGDLKKWITENPSILEEAGLWCEDFSVTKTWVHVQSVPPKSGKRFFMP